MSRVCMNAPCVPVCVPMCSLCRRRRRCSVADCPCASCSCRGMAQMRKLACDGIRTNSRGDLQVPLVSARQEILTSLVSALDSVVRPTTHAHLQFIQEISSGNTSVIVLLWSWSDLRRTSEQRLLLCSAWRCPSSTPRWRASPSMRTA